MIDFQIPSVCFIGIPPISVSIFITLVIGARSVELQPNVQTDFVQFL